MGPEDLLSLHKNIQDLLPPPDDTEDSKLPALPAAILEEELSLGSLDQDNTLDNDDNLLKNTFDKYLPSPSLQNFTANIPFSVITKRSSPTTGSLRTMTTHHLSKIQQLGKIATPRTVSLDTTTHPHINISTPHTTSMATANPFAILNDDNESTVDPTSSPTEDNTSTINFTTTST